MAYERGFPPDEFAARTARAQALMGERGIDALIVCTEPEVRYFTGFHTPFWQSPTRPWFTVVPVTGKPVAVIPGIGAPSMAATWIDDIRTWSSPRPDDDGVSLLIDTVRELVGPDATVGLPMGPETHVRMPLADLDRVRGLGAGPARLDPEVPAEPRALPRLVRARVGGRRRPADRSHLS